jgi:transcriptional regulator with XRE-family HTH domain
VAEPTVWRWEKNGIKTSYEMLERMGEVLRVDPDDILLEAIPKPEEEVTHA